MRTVHVSEMEVQLTYNIHLTMLFFNIVLDFI